MKTFGQVVCQRVLVFCVFRKVLFSCVTKKSRKVLFNLLSKVGASILSVQVFMEFIDFVFVQSSDRTSST